MYCILLSCIWLKATLQRTPNINSKNVFTERRVVYSVIRHAIRSTPARSNDPHFPYLLGIYSHDFSSTILLLILFVYDYAEQPYI